MATSPSYSLDSLFQFVDTAANKGWLPRNTASSLKSAIARVLAVLDEGEKADLRSAEIDAALHRFANLNPDVSPQSLRDYRSRIGRAFDMFMAYRADPVNWKPGRRIRTSRQTATDPGESSSRIKSATSRGKRSPSGTPSLAESTTFTAERAGNLTLPYPLRTDLTVQISNLPRDLKMAEAERLAAFLRSLASDFSPPGSIA